ncbi:hypothetical protein F4679DRAFT_586430 [Xylaria curta]|nr:hypothetical protein F4679DRAFT_586430 [Xylaria curta]
MSTEEKSAWKYGCFFGMGLGVFATVSFLGMIPSNICEPLVPGSNHSARGNQSDSRNQTNHRSPRNLKTYLYKTWIWESNIIFPSAHPVHINSDGFDQIINGTKPSATSIYGYTLDYQPFDQQGNAESSVKIIVPVSL